MLPRRHRHEVAVSRWPKEWAGVRFVVHNLFGGIGHGPAVGELCHLPPDWPMAWDPIVGDYFAVRVDEMTALTPLSRELLAIARQARGMTANTFRKSGLIGAWKRARKKPLAGSARGRKP